MVSGLSCALCLSLWFRTEVSEETVEDAMLFSSLPGLSASCRYMIITAKLAGTGSAGEPTLGTHSHRAVAPAHPLAMAQALVSADIPSPTATFLC